MIRIALDLDGVLVDTARIMKKKVAEKFNLKHSMLKAGHDYNNVYRLEDQELHNVVNDYVHELFNTDAEVYLEGDEVEGSWYGARIVKPVAYITRRPEAYGIREATEKWLEQHNYPDAPLYFIPKGICKSNKAKELGADVLIEDSPQEIISCLENNLRIIAMRYPYNIDVVRSTGVEAMNDWKDIILWYEEQTKYD